MTPPADPRRRAYCLVALAALIGAGCDDAPAVLRVGDRLPELAFARLDGSSATLAEHGGKALVLNIWATWCGPCRAEMPSLQRLADRFSGDDLAVVGVSVDRDLNLVREFLLRHGIRFAVYADSAQPSVRDRLGVKAYPTTWLVRRDRRIAALIAGERDWSGDAMVGRITELLGVQPRSVPSG
jgi:thiol-disulfide isomerase/thioredoxin